ncbi:hypothetical protein [Streptomyces sp. SP17KL33]|uniref:hypothetical protein n=1 Tax=Streptomyces sp. SP17KL33 TaxID=3002534 RepID=UPI002E791444|nr:hypothetical protein [Streptomyces sp. SP17KL33]MEE1837524.1 hypothetical protein [Streptomyces sp. SP17KL33]
MGIAVEDRSFLLIGSQRGDSVTAKLKALGIPYKIKLLESSPENWRTILDILESGSIRAVIARLSGQAFHCLSSPSYRETASAVFERIGQLPHIAFAHEDTLGGEFDPGKAGVYLGYNPADPDRAEEFYHFMFSPPSDQERQAAGEMFAQHQINVIPYSTNAELSVLASNFIDDAEKNLLFRVYVPSGRLYAAEAEKLLSLFHEWLQSGGRSGVRRDGYKTSAGQVFEFLGGETLQRGDLAREFSDFSSFLELCVADPSAAEDSLSRFGVGRSVGAAMVSRYSREVRRLQLDLKHERESRMLTIRHSLEAEILDLGEVGRDKTDVVEELVDSLVPHPRNFHPGNILASGSGGNFPASVTVNLNPQFIHAVESTVLQNIQGTVNLGPEPKQLIELIRQYGGNDADELESAVHELEDEDARPVDRLTARQRLKAFLGRMGTAAEGVAVGVLQKYLESKLSV